VGWTRRTHGSVAFTMAAILMLAACGGDGGGPAGGATDGGDDGPPETACDLLTDDEVAAASGYSIGKIEQANDPSGGRCTWTLESGDAAAPSFVTLVLYVSRGKALFAAGAPGSERAQKGTTTVQGIGDGAYFAEVAGRPTLTVLVGNSAFFVQYFPGQGDDSDAEQAVRELAPLAAGRL
jgi:hypothetical protein